MRYRTEDIEKLSQALHIEEVVGEFVELKKAGSDYKGLCPFHQDNNPSFMVSPSKNICKCFVCGAGGNPITFYSKYKKISFNQAVSELAQKYKVPLKTPINNYGHQEEYEKYYKIMDDAHNFFKEQIFLNSGRDALEYLSRRKITPNIIREHSLGYAPNHWRDLKEYLLSKGHNEKDLLTLGLLKENNEKSSYDAFRNRIIFPIYSSAGKVIAFGGRTLEKDENVPKYINSPDTPIFKKGRNLYGFERNNVIRKKDYAMLMEGYMDVLSACIYGFNTAIAPLGTALTYEQANLLRRYTENIILCFDSDNAGLMATVRAALILKSFGFTIRVLELNGAKDPDEYLKKFGREKFLESIQNSKEIFDFLFKYYSRGYDLTISSENAASISNFINEFKEFFASVPEELEKYLYLDKFASQIDIDKDILKEILITKNNEKIRKYQDYSEENSEVSLVNPKPKETYKTLSLMEVHAIYLCFINKKEYFKYFKDVDLKGDLIKKIFNYFNDKEDISISQMINDLNIDEKEKMAIKDVIIRVTNSPHVTKSTHDLLKDTFLAYFRMEIEDFYITSKKEDNQDLSLAILGLEVKKIAMELDENKDIDTLYELHNKFKKLLQDKK